MERRFLFARWEYSDKNLEHYYKPSAPNNNVGAFLIISKAIYRPLYHKDDKKSIYSLHFLSNSVILSLDFIKTGGVDVREAVAKRLIELMEQKNLSLNGLARLAAIPPSTLKNIIYGKSRNPGVVTIKLLCDGMDITITEFFNSPIFSELGMEEIY